ncbi:hypothetical protein DFJ73DRAFT_841641 [Zopfochytrium polystomum]|nr:hypothetical protein DFJ73DRAFT_841641 [Zopfochytrium polystomum]
MTLGKQSFSEPVVPKFSTPTRPPTDPARTMSNSKQQLAYAICDFLSSSIKNGTIKEDDAEGIEVAIQCIGEAFGFDFSDDSVATQLSVKPATLPTIFDVFLKTQRRMSGSQKEAESPEVIKAKAEALKAAGNKLMGSQQYKEAIEKYTEAIAIDGSNAVYYSNRAAAYSQDGDHANAVEDAKRAIEVDPDFSKAYSRMGHAYFCLGSFADAVDAYERGLRLDPGNQSMKQSLVTAKQKLDESGAGKAATSSRGASGAGAGAGAGGLDFGSMLSNPAFMNMASQFMSNPAMSQMLNNPAIAQMAQNLMSNPEELQNLMRNPEMARMAAGLAGSPPPPPPEEK